MVGDRHGLTLLLSLGGLPIACAPENDSIPADSDDETSTGAGTSTGGDSTGPSTGPSTTLWDTDVGTGAHETGGYHDLPPPVHPPCIAYYDTIRACFPDAGAYDAAYYAAYCDMYLDAGLQGDGQACADAIAAHFVCLSDLSCAELTDDAPHCDAEEEAAIAACPTLFNGESPDSAGP